MGNIKEKKGLISGSIMLTIARVISSACAFLLFWFISQESIAQLGAFRTLFIYFLVSEFIPLLGMNQLIIREISKKPEKINDYLLHAFIFSIIISAGMAFILCFISFYGGYSPVVSKGLLIIIIGLPATSAALCFQSVLIATGNGGKLGGIQGVEVVIRTIAGFVAISFCQNILYVIAMFVFLRWLITLIYWKHISPLTKKYKWKINRYFFKIFLQSTPQFATILALFLIIRFTGQLMVPWMEGDVAAGLFAIIYQFIDLILLVPTAFTINLMPVLARKAEKSLFDLNSTSKQAMKLTSFIVIPCTLFVFTNAQGVILLIFGEQYQPAVFLVTVSIWAALIFSFDQVLSTSMIAAGKQNLDLISLTTGAIATTGAMYFLILYNGIKGAAAGMLFGAVTLFLTRIIIYNIKMASFNLPVILWRQTIAGIAMFGGMFLFQNRIFLSGFVGSVIYLLVLFWLGNFNLKEKALYSDLFRK